MMTSEKSISMPIFLGFSFSLEDFLGVETEGCDILHDIGGEVMEILRCLRMHL